jgi:UDP-N-acetylmuramoyl-tripeptide--D-alanyl-D-alanine ligase
MFELGENEKELHATVGEHAAKIGIDVVVCIGGLSENTKNGALAVGSESEVLHFATKAEFLAVANDVIKKNDTILVKASHGMAFPEIVEYLQNMKF